MAHTLSAQKRIRQSEKRRLSNKSTKSRMRTYIKKFEQALVTGSVEKTEEALRKSIKMIQKAVGKNVIHKNQAARRTSRMAKKLNELKGSKKAD